MDFGRTENTAELQTGTASVTHFSPLGLIDSCVGTLGPLLRERYCWGKNEALLYGKFCIESEVLYTDEGKVEKVMTVNNRYVLPDPGRCCDKGIC
jgi:hypothetical protein